MCRHGTEGHDLGTLGVVEQWLDSVILMVSSNLNDSVVWHLSLLFFLAENQAASGFSPVLLCGFSGHWRVQQGGPEVNGNPVIGNSLKTQSKGAGLLWGFFTSHGEAEFHILVAKRPQFCSYRTLVSLRLWWLCHRSNTCWILLFEVSCRVSPWTCMALPPPFQPYCPIPLVVAASPLQPTLTQGNKLSSSLCTFRLLTRRAQPCVSCCRAASGSDLPWPVIC